MQTLLIDLYVTGKQNVMYKLEERNLKLTFYIGVNETRLE